jgi:hypothetical protein
MFGHDLGSGQKQGLPKSGADFQPFPAAKKQILPENGRTLAWPCFGRVIGRFKAVDFAAIT